jgi:hypothetical protein
MFNTPIITLLNLHIYCVTGGVILGIIIGLIASWLFYRFIQALRTAMTISSKNKLMSKIAGNFISKLLVRLVFGKQKDTSADTAKSPYIRKGFVYPLIIVIVLLFITEFFVINSTIKSIVISSLEKAVGAEVNVSKVNCSLLSGSIELENLQVTDPSNPTDNMLYVKNGLCDLSISSLLNRSIVFDKVILKGVQSGVKREQLGKVYTKQTQSTAASSHEKFISKNEYNILDKVKKGQKYLDTVQKYYKILNNSKRAAKSKDSNVSDTEQKMKSPLMERSAAELIATKPTVLIKELESDLKQPYPNNITILNLSTEPHLVKDAMIIDIVPVNKVDGPIINMSFSEKSGNGNAYITFNASGINLGALELTKQLPYQFKSSGTDVNAVGNINPENIDIPFTLTMHNLEPVKADNNSKGSFLDTGKLKPIDKLTLFFKLVGTSGKLNIVSEKDKNISSVNSVLGAQAGSILTGTINKQLKEHGNALPEDIKNSINDKKIKNLKDTINSFF